MIWRHFGAWICLTNTPKLSESKYQAGLWGDNFGPKSPWSLYIVLLYYMMNKSKHLLKILLVFEPRTSTLTPKALFIQPLLSWLLTELNLYIISGFLNSIMSESGNCKIYRSLQQNSRMFQNILWTFYECSNRSSEKVFVLLEYLNAIQ